MKKILFLFIGISFSMASINSVLFKSFRKKLLKKSGNLITKSVKKIDESNYMKKLLKNSKIKIHTPVDKLAASATLLAKRGGMVETLTKKYPLKMVNYSARYGEDFIKITNKMLPKIQNIKIPKNLLQKYNIKDIDILKNKSKIGERFLDVLKWTGKKGFEISKSLFKYANENKFSAAAGIAFAWFLADSESFSNALNKFGGNIKEFLTAIATAAGNTIENTSSNLTKIAGDTVANTTNNAIYNITSSIGKMINLRNILFLLAVIIIIFFCKFKNHIGNLIKKYINLKFKQKEKELDDKLEELNSRSRYE